MRDASPRRADHRVSPAALLLAVGLAAACGSTEGLRPIAYPDASAPCPAGRTVWGLEVLDRRAARGGTESLVSLVRDSIVRSFPGCRWNPAAGEDAGRIVIEIHRFAASPEGNLWDAAAEWTIVASDPAGRTLTEFEAREQVSRPNYRGSNNAREALREAFDRALRRTLEVLKTVSSAGERRPPERTAGTRLAGRRGAADPDPTR